MFVQKSHDLDLDIPVASENRYLIQVRHIVPQTISNFELWVSARHRKDFDTREKFLSFAAHWVTYYRGFVQKWILGKPAVAHKLVIYEELLRNPSFEMADTIRFLSPEEPLDFDRLDDSLRKEAPEAKRRIEEFRFYDEAFLASIEEQARPELTALGLDRIF